MNRDPDYELRVRALMRSTAKHTVTVDDLKAAERARRLRANKAESDVIRNFEPTVFNAPHARPPTNFGAKDLAGDQYVVDDFTDSQGVTHHGPPSKDGMTGGTRSGDGGTGGTAMKGKDVTKCLEHAARIANIHAQPDFSEAAKSAAIRGANAEHAPECQGLCDQLGTASKAAVAYNPSSETQRVARFTSTNRPGRR